MTDLLFYDTEATDADKRHGQITQFGGLRTNMDMKVLSTMDLRVRPLPWVVVTPEALAVTGMEISELFSPEAVPEFEAAHEIQKFLNPGYTQERVFVTFFGIDFDDELIRRTLFRNLQHPYPTSGKKSSRVDMLSGIRVAHHFQPGVIETVFDEEKQRLSWRLEKICPANGIELRAHDALGDSYGLMELTRLVRERAPWVWDTLVKCGNPARVDEMMKVAASKDEPLFMFTHFGKPDVVPCFPLATDGRRKHVLADLRAEEYPCDMDSASLVINKAGTPFPIMKSNLSPIFVSPEQALKIHDFDMAALSEKIRNIKSSEQIRVVADAVCGRNDFKTPENQTSEEKIYAGFIEGEDKHRMKRFLETGSWDERAHMQFDDDRLKDFSARIVLDAAYNGEIVLERDITQELEDRCHEALARPYAGSDARWATVASVMERNPPQYWVDWATDYFALESDWGDEEAVSIPEAPVQMGLPF